MIKIATIVLALLTGLTQAAVAQPYREHIEWCDIWIPDADQPDTPHVLLIGDSITRNYYGGVAKQLAPDATVARLTTSRSVCDPMFVDELRPVVEGYHWAVIHFNNGIHGTEYSDAQYRDAFRKVVEYLKKSAGHATIIVTLSTPPRPGSDAERAKQIRHRNDIALKIARQHGLPVDDLHALMLGRADDYRDMFHFKSAAVSLQVKQVAGMVRKGLDHDE